MENIDHLPQPLSCVIVLDSPGGNVLLTFLGFFPKSHPTIVFILILKKH